MSGTVALDVVVCQEKSRRDAGLQATISGRSRLEHVPKTWPWFHPPRLLRLRRQGEFPRQRPDGHRVNNATLLRASLRRTLPLKCQGSRFGQGDAHEASRLLACALSRGLAGVGDG